MTRFWGKLIVFMLMLMGVSSVLAQRFGDKTGEVLLFLGRDYGKAGIYLLDLRHDLLWKTADQYNVAMQWSPTGDAFTYLSDNHELNLVSLKAGTPSHIVETEETIATLPQWSPTGDSFVYHRLTEDFPASAYLVNPFKGSQTPIAPLDTEDDFVVEGWSPNGRYLIYQVGHDDLNWYLQDVTNGRSHPLNLPDLVPGLNVWWIANVSANHYFAYTSLVWLPNGEQFIFPHTVDDYTTEIHLYDVADFSHAPLLTDIEGLVVMMRWSSDNRYLAYMTQFERGGFEAHIYDACTQQHLDTNIIFTNPTIMEWSPNDQHLAFTAGISWRAQIFVYSIGDSQLKRIPSLGNDNQMNMSWSPDGDSLIYSGLDQENSIYGSKLYRYHVPSGEQTILAPEFQFADSASWQPHRNRGNVSSACAV